MIDYFKAHVLGMGLAAATFLTPAQSKGPQPGERSISVRVTLADLDITFAYERCRAAAITQAVSGVNAPMGVVRLIAPGPGRRGGPQ